MADTFETMLERAGLSLASAEVERLRPYYEQYVAALAPLYEADLDGEEVAGRFVAAPGQQPETRP